ncbi:MAG: DeoR/GlpR family DNA-binding transcription regulator [Bacillota bacterium]
MNKHQKKIMNYLTEHTQTDVDTLSKKVALSSSTIRRQLSELQEKGLLVRTHGGAMLPNPIHYGSYFETRVTCQMEAKRMIASLAKKQLTPNLIIGISGGSTCTELARQLRALSGFTIVTNALNIAIEMQGPLSNRIIVTGGVLNQSSYELVGNQVAESLKNVSLDIAFLGCSGIDCAFGFSMFDEPEAVAGRAFMAASRKTIVLADHTKLSRTEFARLCPIEAVDMLITDEGVSDEQIRSLKKVNLEVLVASTDLK